MSLTLRPLTSEEALSPYQPGDEQPFNHRRAAHLLRRSGFGAPHEDMESAIASGPGATVDRLLDPEDDPATAEMAAIAHTVAAKEIDALQGWWATRIIRSRSPLTEKIALFWHGHFATSFEKVQNEGLMLDQLGLFHRFGQEPFVELLRRILKDPAMLIWLDGDENRRNRPNENLARELFELFSLGRGNYTEPDIREAARALTGWRRSGGTFKYIATQHDDGTKEVLGRRGQFDQDDLADICAKHPATSVFLTRKLLRFFVHPEPREDIVQELASRFHQKNLDVRWFLSTVLRSRYFFSDDCLDTHVLSPAEYVLGTLRSLGARADGKEAAREMSRMGQTLFLPPSVKGWDGEKAWIHTGFMIARMNFATRIARGEQSGLIKNINIRAILGQPSATPEEIARHVTRRLLAREIDENVTAEIARLIAEETDPDRQIAIALGASLAIPEASIG